MHVCTCRVTFTYNLFNDVTTHGVYTVILRCVCASVHLCMYVCVCVCISLLTLFSPSTETKKTSPAVVLSDVEVSVSLYTL